MSGRTKPKKKGIFSKFPSFRKKKTSSTSSVSPDRDANANPPMIPPPLDFASTVDNDTFIQPTLNLNNQQPRVDNSSFKVPAAPVAALNTSTNSQSAKRPNATDEYQVGSGAKRMNKKSEKNDCTIIVNASVQAPPPAPPSKTANTNQALKSAFFGTTPSSEEVKQNGEVLNKSTSKNTATDLPKTIHTAPDSSATSVPAGQKDDNENPWHHMSNIRNSEKNKNDIWLSKGNSSWVNSPSAAETQHSVVKKEASEVLPQSESSSQNTTFVLDHPVLDSSNKNSISVRKDLYNSNNTYLLDREKHDNKIRLTYTGATSRDVGGTGDAGLPTTCEALRKTDLNNEEIQLDKPTGSLSQQASVKTKAESHRTISTGSQDALGEHSPRVGNNIQGRHESQSESSPKNITAASSVPTQSTPTKQMPLSTVRHPQLSAVKGRFYSTSVESTELDSIASDDLMCDSRFIDDEMMGFDEESFLSDMADGPKNSILQTRLSRNGRIRSQSFEVSSKHEEKVIDSRRLRSITMGASPPSKVYDSTPGSTIPEDPQPTTNERSKENHVGFSRFNRSLHLNLPSQLSFTSDEEVTMDANTFRHLMQDMTNMKTMLFKLKRVIQDNNNAAAMTGSLPTSPITTSNPLLGQDNILVDLTQENVQLKTEINSMKKLIEETDKTVARLHDELLDFQSTQIELVNSHQVPKRDIGVQADLPIISYKVYKPSYIPRPTTFRTRSEVSRIKAAFEEYMRINGRKIPTSYPSANPEQILPLSPTKSESQQHQPKPESPQSQRKTSNQELSRLGSPKSYRKTKQHEQPLSPENKLPKPVRISPTEAPAKQSLLQPAAGKRQLQAPKQLNPAGKHVPEQAKEQLPRPTSIKSPIDDTTTLESSISPAETNKSKSKLPQSRLPKSSTLTKLGSHPMSRNGNQTKSDEDINTTTKSGSCNQLQSLTSSNSKSKLAPPSKVMNKEENGNKAEKRYSDQTLEQRFSPKVESCSKADEPMAKQKSRSKLMAPGFIKKIAKSSSTENVSSHNSSHDNLQNGLQNNSQIKPISNGNKSDENLTENDTKKQTKSGIKKPNSPKNERPLSGGMDSASRIPGPKSRTRTGIPSRKTNQP